MDFTNFPSLDLKQQISVHVASSADELFAALCVSPAFQVLYLLRALGVLRIMPCPTCIAFSTLAGPNA